MRSFPLFSRTVAAMACALALAQGAAARPDTSADAQVANSPLDAQLFYQLLIGEMELRSGQVGTAFQVLMDAARKTRDEALFRRATDIAFQARAGEQALMATRAWRQALPQSLDALRYELQILVGLNRPAEAAEPIRTLLQLSPPAERVGIITTLPRLFARAADKTQTARLLEEALQPSVADPATRVAATVTQGRAWLAADDKPRAMDLAKRAHALDPGAEMTALLALELMPTVPQAETIVTSHLQAKPESSTIRLVYARVLTALQRYTDAIPVLETLTRLENAPAVAWLTLGALHLELKHPLEATDALNQYLQRVQGSASPAEPAAAADDDDDTLNSAQGTMQAYLLLSRASEQQGDFAKAEEWLSKVSASERGLDVVARRASLVAKQGRVDEARALIRQVPERSDEDVRAKLLAEAQLLRDVKQWAAAYAVLADANKRFPDDIDLLYEQSMMAEKMNRLSDMEQMLRRVIEIKPDHHHAYNALGYTLADRNIRLEEARTLILKALSLAPGDPFITDSLGWVEYRLGNRDEALRLLMAAYRARPDVEIGAHLGEVLWMANQHEEARRIWRLSRDKDGTNVVLQETLARLRVDL